jgi:hypothetical protein
MSYNNLEIIPAYGTLIEDPTYRFGGWANAAGVYPTLNSSAGVLEESAYSVHSSVIPNQSGNILVTTGVGTELFNSALGDSSIGRYFIIDGTIGKPVEVMFSINVISKINLYPDPTIEGAHGENKFAISHLVEVDNGNFVKYLNSPISFDENAGYNGRNGQYSSDIQSTLSGSVTLEYGKNYFFHLVALTETDVRRFQPVPEPSTYLAGLSALGMLGLFGWRNRR